MTSAAPVARTERILAIDVLRGFALLGILVANITLFDVDGFDAVEQSFDDLVIGPAGVPFMFVFLVLGRYIPTPRSAISSPEPPTGAPLVSLERCTVEAQLLVL